MRPAIKKLFETGSFGDVKPFVERSIFWHRFVILRPMTLSG
jgi:hypothetical protein